MVRSHELDNAECERLLRAGITGRMGLSSPSGQHIVPVNYSVVDDAVTVRTTPDSVLAKHGPGHQLAFEIDHIDYERHGGWSVVAKGPVDVVSDPDEVARIRHEWPPRPWASGERDLLLRLRWTELTGRRLGEGWSDDRDLPVRRVLKARPGVLPPP